MNPDRKKKIKRIIAREGLILLSVIVVGLLLFWLGSFLNTKFLEQFKGTRVVPYLFGYKLQDGIWIQNIGFSLLIIGYPFYLLIRFILWALRTLRER